MLPAEMPPTERSVARSRPLRRVLALVSLLALGAGLAATASDEWLVYIGAGLEAIDGGWEERRGQVLFRLRGGTLVSVPFADVDLPASAVVTWQLSGRRVRPPQLPLPDEAPAEPAAEPPCVAARVVSLRSGEILEVSDGKRREIVHPACLDAPETAHKYPQLGWFGRATLSAVELAVPAGAHVCLTEQTPPKRDREGHRVVYITLADGRDYTAEVIAGGLGMVRPTSCARAARYRRIEDKAIASQRGLWGGMAAKAAFSAGSLALSVSSGPPPPRRSGGGRG